MGLWRASAFGEDYQGDPTGFVVERYVWVFQNNPHRTDGMNQICEQAGRFVANYRVEGSLAAAQKSASDLADALNSIPMAYV